MVEARAPLPIPADFPFEWPDPAHERLPRSWGQMHPPHPMTPLTDTFEAPAFAKGTSAGFQALRIPVSMLVLVINGYHYFSRPEPDEGESMQEGLPAEALQEFMRRLPVLTQ